MYANYKLAVTDCSDWANTRKLRLSISKCNVLNISRLPVDAQYSLAGCIVPIVLNIVEISG